MRRFLAQPVFLVAGIQPIGDGPIAGRVLRKVGVEQKQRRRADLDPPHTRPSDVIAEIDRHAGPAIFEAQLLGVLGLIPLVLTAAGHELAKETLAVEQADAGERYGGVARGFEVIAGEDRKSVV